MAKYDLVVGVFDGQAINYTTIACDYMDTREQKRLLLNVAISEGFNPNNTVLVNNFNRVQFYINIKTDDGLTVVKRNVPLITRIKGGEFV